MKRLLRIFIFVVILLGTTSILFTPAAQAGDFINHEVEAHSLQALGLFSGTDQGFELTRIPSRVEGAVMLVRLLGKGEYAIDQNFPHPFKDVPVWADPYVGYMYAAGLTAGTGPSTFSPDFALTTDQYLSFVLRSLGYNDQNGDFQWNRAMDKSEEIGLIDSSTRKELETSFSRDEMVLVSYLALKSNLKDSNYTLLQKLVEVDKVVSPINAQASGLYTLRPGDNNIENGAIPYVSETSNGYLISNQDELKYALAAAMLELKTAFVLNFDTYPGDPLNDFETVINQAMELISQKTGVEDLLSRWEYSGTTQKLNIKMQYRYDQERFAQELGKNEVVQEKAEEIIRTYIKPGMTEYDKEKVLHDYIVNHSQYDYENLMNNTIPHDSFTPYGILILGRGVCQGYAEAFELLGKKAGLECQVVIGKAYGVNQWSGHAWNIVKIGDRYYHLDVTFDDPVIKGGNGILRYNYYNLTDTEITKDHKWDRSAYPACTATK